MLRKLVVFLCVLSMAACSTGRMFQIGYYPISQLDHRQTLNQSDYKEARRK